MESEWSMENPLHFRDGPPSTDHQRVHDQTLPGCNSMKSDQSMGVPLNFYGPNLTMDSTDLRGQQKGQSDQGYQTDLHLEGPALELKTLDLLHLLHLQENLNRCQELIMDLRKEIKKNRELITFIHEDAQCSDHLKETVKEQQARIKELVEEAAKTSSMKKPAVTPLTLGLILAVAAVILAIWLAVPQPEMKKIQETHRQEMADVVLKMLKSCVVGVALDPDAAKVDVVDVLLRNIKRYAVDVTLDSHTANRFLILSDDGKQVRHGNTWKNLPDNKERFSPCPCVLGQQGFSSGRFYYEVQVKGKTGWTLGVVRESIKRKGYIALTPNDGFWTISLSNGNEYKAHADPSVLLSVRQKVQTVGMFVDYEMGLVSFYDVETRVHLYSYTGCSFTERTYPYFNPGPPDGAKNSGPLLIV